MAKDTTRQRAPRAGLVGRREVLARPCDSQTLAGPEDPERAQDHAHRELERVFRYARKWAMHDRTDDQNDDTSGQGAERRRKEQTATCAHGDHDEHDLEALE